MALATLCVLFGVFAFILPLPVLVMPAVGAVFSYAGLWDPEVATGLLIVGSYLFFQHTNDVFGQVIVGSIVIFCWVALWDPIDLFLHQYIIQKGIVRIGEKRIVNCTVKVQKARTGPDGMPEQGDYPAGN